MPQTSLDIRQSVYRSALNMAGTAANASVDTILTPFDAQIGKLFEDRNIMLTGGGTIANSSGTSLSFGANLVVYINSNIAGAAPYVVTILASTSPWAFTSDGNMAYITITSRSAGTFTLTTDASSLPAVSNAHQEVFMIAKRIGTTIFMRDGSSLQSGQSGVLGTMNTSGTSTVNGMISNNNSAGTGGLTVATGTSLFNPYLTIVSGDTYVVNSGAELVTVTSLIVTGTLTVNGETRVL